MSAPPASASAPRNFTLRRALPSDAELLANFVVRASIAAYVAPVGLGLGDPSYILSSQFQSDILRARHKSLSDPRVLVLLAVPPESENEILGIVEFGSRRSYVDLDGRCESEWEVWMLYVSPNAKGTGVGRQMVTEAMRLGGVRPGERVVVLTFKGNTAGQAFYKRLGAELKYDCPNYIWGGKKYDVVALEWSGPALRALLDV